MGKKLINLSLRILMEELIMSRKSDKHLTAGDQLTLRFGIGADDNCHVQVSGDNVIKFDNNRQGGTSSRDCQKRERIIGKLLCHAERLRW